jgi:DNA-binding MarR family transcriptional regulator
MSRIAPDAGGHALASRLVAKAAHVYPSQADVVAVMKRGVGQGAGLDRFPEFFVRCCRAHIITISYYTIMALLLIPPIHRATHRIGLYIGRAPGLSVTQAEAHILAHLAGAGDCTIAQLHQVFAHKRSTLTSILDRLAERGFIVRESDARDRRSFHVRLTPNGAKAAKKVSAWLERLERAVLARLAPAQLRGFTKVVSTLQEQAKGR